MTQAEAEAYRRWRDGYQRNWRWAFDPIALRLTLRQDRLAADLTVMPLICGTQYREFVSISQRGEVRPRRRRPARRPGPFHPGHQPQVAAFGQAEQLRRRRWRRGSTLGWLGSSVAVYADDDPFWEELAKTSPTRSWTSRS